MKRNKRTWTLTDYEMNTISLYLHEASESYKDRGCNTHADEAAKIATEIYEILDHAGYYDR